MSLMLDDFFKDTYGSYFDGYSTEIVMSVINSEIEKTQSEIIIDASNIVKTSAVVGETFEKCHSRINDKIISKFPNDRDIDKFILAIVLKVLINQDCEKIKKFLNFGRDLDKEVTAKLFRVPERKVTDEMIAKMRESLDNFSGSYSIDDPPVGSWDEWFYNVCRQVARNSKCLSRRIGAVLVYDKSIRSTGYNGPPRGVPRCDLRWQIDSDFYEKYKDRIEGKDVKGVCPRYVIGFKSGEGLSVCPAGHAERNALINAARDGISTRDTTLYMTCGIPCTPCLVEIINAGVKEIVVTSLKVYDETAMYLLNTSQLKVRVFDFIK